MTSLMTEDHAFVDSDGSEIRGRERMSAAWAQYFRMFPDYQIEVQETYRRGRVVILVGAAQGTYAAGGELRSEDHWRVPAVWRAEIAGESLAQWRIYVNVEPVRQIVAKYQG